MAGSKATIALVLTLYTAAVAAVATEPPPGNALRSHLVTQHLKYASELSRYPLIGRQPVVLVLPDGLLPKVYGLFRPDTPEFIYVNESTPAALQRSVLVHELVHYLQFHAGVLPEQPSCHERAALEAEAYIASFRFELKYLGGALMPLDVTRSNCEARGIPDDAKQSP